MSYTLSRYFQRGLNFIDRVGLRHAWKRKGIDPEIEGRTLEQKTKDHGPQYDPATDYKVDIGYRYATPSRKDVLKDRLAVRRQLKSSLEMEKAARARTINIPLEDVHAEWCATSAPFKIKEVAEYFNVFQDLFEDAYFYPVTTLEILYPQEKGDAPVYQGNLLKPAELTKKPIVNFKGVEDALYTLVLSTPDCHLTQEEGGEYLHWMVGNIPGNGDVSKGTEVCDYLQPFPPRGVGYCRYVFVLYRQEGVIDFDKYQRPPNCKNLAQRTFYTYDFYRDLQDRMTPTGLAFFQSNWDSSLTSFFHNELEMKEPIFEYDFPPPSLPPQQWIPGRRPFNLYLDRYKHPKTLGRELFLEKMKEVHPFEKPPPPLKYPNIFPIGKEVPTWLKDEIKRKRLRQGKWKYM